MRKQLEFFGMAACLLFLLACQSAPRQAETEREKTFTDCLTAEDTLAVERLVNQFWDLAREQRYEAAAALLYKPDAENAWRRPTLLDNDELHRVAGMLARFPAKQCRIESMDFRTAIDNDVKCVIVLREAEGDTPEVTAAWHFKPLNYLGQWLLCLQGR